MAKLYIRNAANTAWVPLGGVALEEDIIHDNVSGEINSITEKTTPVSADLILIEDSAASNAKKKLQVGNLLSQVVVPVVKGFAQRSAFTYKDADEIYISAGTYHHAGTVEQNVYWNSQLTKQGTFTGTQWYYLYIDDSAISSPLLTASQLLFSTTAPSWSEAKHGWYNGNDRCIFAVHVSSGSLSKFWHDGGDFIQFDSDYEPRSFASLAASTWTNITCRVPSFCTQVQASIGWYYGVGSLGTEVYMMMRPDGSTGGGVRIATAYRGSGTIAFVSPVVRANVVSGIFEIWHNSSSAESVGVNQSGWYLPKGF